MATVKGILVNDGGAPARIINFIAAADISDRCLMINAKALILELPSGHAPNDGYRSSYVVL